MRLRPFQWSRTYAVSPQVDDEHRSLFRLGGELRRAILAEAAGSALQAASRELAIHAARHFSHEEREMRGARYSLFQWHRRQHAAGRAKIRALQNSIRRGDRLTAGEQLKAVNGWLSSHILFADRMWAAHVHYESLRR